ncbi:hypothetical protein M426DRAFT_27353 [Hypoxylon sp. CI-4A]|nr:hypothetical protein M426DRAFT_27353 [Hypoxylon sp. CI-4A]
MGFAAPRTTAAPALSPRVISSLDHDGTPPVAALTTVWTPSPGCFSVSTRSLTDIDIFWSANPECGPPGYSSYFDTFYYSPAICPSGYSIGCSRYEDNQGPSVEPTETAMLCVMSGYSCAPYEWNYYATNSDSSYEQMMIEIRWAESDLSILETHPLTPGLILATGTSGSDGSATGTETLSGVATVTVTSSDFDSTGRGLSTGAQAGIGLGVGLFGLLVIGIAIFFFLRYREKRARGDNVDPSPSMQQSSTSGYPFPQYAYMSGAGQLATPGYVSYVDPKTGAMTYYHSAPQPTGLGGATAKSPNQVHIQQPPPAVVSQPTRSHEPAAPANQSLQPQPNADVEGPSAPAASHDPAARSPTVAGPSGQ